LRRKKATIVPQPFPRGRSEAISELRHTTSGISEPAILAAILRDILLDAGTLLGLAGIVYLLAPSGEEGPAADPPIDDVDEEP
jgi:hypothetical protein